MEIYRLIKKLSSFCPIRGKNEKKKAANLLLNILESFNVEVQKFKNVIPDVFNSKIKPKIGLISTFSSGKICVEERNIISNFCEFDRPNINFNPFCQDISLVTFYRKPAVTVSKSDVEKLIELDKIKVKVKKERFISYNILVGSKNPRYLVLTHYDTVLSGTCDNISGTSFLIHFILKNQQYLKNTLFVFSGSEELTYYDSIYWGYGYRIFEEEHLDILKNCKRIVVVDSLGLTKSYIDKEFLKEAFPIKNLEIFKRKIFLITGINKNYWKIYHSNLDNLNYIEKIEKNFIKNVLDTEGLLKKIIKN
jgi:hypothetical protein